MPKKLTINEFIDKANRIHKNKYDYSKSKYVNARSDVTVICLKHGNFSQNAHVHLKGHGCPKCANEFVGKLFATNTTEFINAANKIHNNKYDYSKIVYKNKNEKITIICKIHGAFSQTPNNHLHCHGCPKCSFENTAKLKSMKFSEFYSKSCNVHKNKYRYSNENFKNRNSKISIECKSHGIFVQLANDHLNGSGCPKCNLSKGEIKIETWLEENNILFIPQHKFDDCKNPKTNYKLKFDFYLPKNNIVIEYDGFQHFNRWGFNNIEDIQFRDNIKNEYCRNKNMKLIRIPYTEIKNINGILVKEILNTNENKK
jgi:hypothetical protein